MKIRQLPKDDRPLKPFVRKTYTELEGEPWIEVRVSSKANEPLFNALLRLQHDFLARQRGNAPTVALLDGSYRATLNAYIDHGIHAIGGWVDGDTGEEIPSNKDGFRAVLEALPEDMFEALQAVAKNEEMFRSQGD